MRYFLGTRNTSEGKPQRLAISGLAALRELNVMTDKENLASYVSEEDSLGTDLA